MCNDFALIAGTLVQAIKDDVCTLAISKCLKLLVWLQGWGELLDLVSLSRVFLLFGRAESQSIRVARSTVSLAG